VSDRNVKICPNCETEYHPDGDVCADCGTVLVHKHEQRDGTEPLSDDDKLTGILEDRMESLEETRLMLNANGVRTHVRLHTESPAGPHANVFGLYVLTDELAEAQELHRTHWLKGAPEGQGSFEYKEQELSGTCPACDTTLPEAAVECPECGLVVGHDDDGDEDDEVEVCPRCDTEVEADATTCPGCGAQFE